MKIIRTKNLEKAILPFEVYEQTLPYSLNPPKEIFGIDGETAVNEMKKLNIDCSSKLSPNCLYVFRKTSKGNKLVAHRVTMSEKTKRNYLNGSKKYGELHILKDTFGNY